MARTGTFTLKAGTNSVSVTAAGTAADSTIVVSPTSFPGEASGQVALAYVTKSAGVGFVANFIAAPRLDVTCDYSIL